MSHQLENQGYKRRGGLRQRGGIRSKFTNYNKFQDYQDDGYRGNEESGFNSNRKSSYQGSYPQRNYRAYKNLNGNPERYEKSVHFTERGYNSNKFQTEQSGQFQNSKKKYFQNNRYQENQDYSQDQISNEEGNNEGKRLNFQKRPYNQYTPYVNKRSKGILKNRPRNLRETMRSDDFNYNYKKNENDGFQYNQEGGKNDDHQPRSKSLFHQQNKQIILPIANPTGYPFQRFIRVPSNIEALKKLQIKQNLQKIGQAPRAYSEILQQAENGENMDMVDKSQNERLRICDRFEKIQNARRAIHPMLVSKKPLQIDGFSNKFVFKSSVAQRLHIRKANMTNKRKLKTLKLN